MGPRRGRSAERSAEAGKAARRRSRGEVSALFLNVFNAGQHRSEPGMRGTFSSKGLQDDRLRTSKTHPRELTSPSARLRDAIFGSYEYVISVRTPNNHYLVTMTPHI